MKLHGIVVLHIRNILLIMFQTCLIGFLKLVDDGQYIDERTTVKMDISENDNPAYFGIHLYSGRDRGYANYFYLYNLKIEN